MALHAFQCSTCGGPLLPKGNSAIIQCPYCRTAVAVPESLRQNSAKNAWSTLVFDAFTTNEHNWLVGNQSGERFATLTRAIADGRYRWQAQTSIPASIAPAWLMGYPVADFHLSVNCKHIRGSRAGSSWGVIFRIQDNQNCYCFRIIDTQFFAVTMCKAGTWQTITDWQRTDTIKPNGVNQAEVIAQQTHYVFLINGQVVHEIDADQLSQGLVGLAIEGYTLQEELVFDFLDIRLRVP